MDALLDRETLAQLTGTVQPKRMCAWLTDNGWIFVAPRRRGDVPKVARAYFDARMSGQQPTPAGQKRRVATNLDWMLNPT